MFLDKNKKIKAAYRALFLAPNGLLKPEAETVFDDLYEFARMFKNAPTDPQALAMIEGGRSTVRHILKRIGAEARESVRQRNRHITGGDIND